MPNYVEIVDEAESMPVKIGDSVFTIRRFTQEAVEEIAQRHRVRRKDNQGRVYAEIPADRMVAFTADLYDHLILDWTDVIHPVTRQPVPCDAVHKAKLPQPVRDRLLEAADAANLSGLRPDPTTGSAPRSGGS